MQPFLCKFIQRFDLKAVINMRRFVAKTGTVFRHDAPPQYAVRSHRRICWRLEGCGHYESLNDWRRLFWGTHQRECFVRLKKKLHRDIDFLISLVILLNLWGQQWWFIAAPLHFYSAVRRASNTICKVEFSNLFSHTCFLNTLTEKLLEIAFFATLSFCQSVKNA